MTEQGDEMIRVVRALLIAALVLVVGCGGGDPEAETSASPEAAAAEPTQSPAAPSEEAEPTEASEEPTEASEEPTEVAAAEVEPAKELLVPLSGGYAYGPLPKSASQGLEQQLSGGPAAKVIGDFATRSVTKGGKPVAVLFAIRFSAEATNEDKAGFAGGVAQGAGGKARAVTIAGKEAVFIKAATPAFLVPGEDYALLFFGQKRGAIEPVVEAVIKGLE